jgi:hypothetical protein
VDLSSVDSARLAKTPSSLIAIVIAFEFAFGFSEENSLREVARNVSESVFCPDSGALVETFVVESDPASPREPAPWLAALGCVCDDGEGGVDPFADACVGPGFDTLSFELQAAKSKHIKRAELFFMSDFIIHSPFNTVQTL